MAGIGIRYDFVRGGFYVGFLEERPASEFFGAGAGLDQSNKVELAHGGLSILTSKDGIVGAVTSDFGYGGLPLRGWFQGMDGTLPRPPEGFFDVSSPRWNLGHFQVRHDLNRVELWWSGGEHLPREHWTHRVEPSTGVAAWYSSKTTRLPGSKRVVNAVAGLGFDTRRLVVPGPYELVVLFFTDMKD
ncbi:MAG: hypothetical protein HYV63_20960 [Candidatus Schekmanbacteria bacterium]|nr:hypothetical protein [Candidatus Schekmanbacteria bacterium]